MFEDDVVETGPCLRTRFPAEDNVKVFILAISCQGRLPLAQALIYVSIPP